MLGQACLCHVPLTAFAGRRFFGQEPLALSLCHLQTTCSVLKHFCTAEAPCRRHAVFILQPIALLCAQQPPTSNALGQTPPLLLHRPPPIAASILPHKELDTRWIGKNPR